MDVISCFERPLFSSTSIGLTYCSEFDMDMRFISAEANSGAETSTGPPVV